MKLIIPSGVTMFGECEIQSPNCTAIHPSPITAVFEIPGRIQVNVCRACLLHKIGIGEWLEESNLRVSQSFDLGVFGKGDNLILAVEVKLLPRSRSLSVDTETIAFDMLNGIIRRRGLPKCEYFLLVLMPRTLCLCKMPERIQDGVQIFNEYFDIPTKEYASRLSDEINPNDKRSAPILAEIYVYFWLRDIVKEDLAKKPSMFHQSGLQAEMGGTTIRFVGPYPRRFIKASESD
jgi:hypothetical protein